MKAGEKVRNSRKSSNRDTIIMLFGECTHRLAVLDTPRSEGTAGKWNEWLDDGLVLGPHGPSIHCDRSASVESSSEP